MEPTPPENAESRATPAGSGGGLPPGELPPYEPPDVEAPAGRRRGRLLLLVLVVVALVGGGAAAAAFMTLRGSSEQLLGVVPASSDVVVTAYLDPSAGQKVNLFRLAHRFPALASETDLRQGVHEVVDEALSESGVTLDDVTPWLGSEVSIVIDAGPAGGDPRTGAIVDSTDDDAATAALEHASSSGGWTTRDYHGVAMHLGTERAWAIVNGVVVLSDGSGFLTEVIDTAQGRTASLADDSGYLQTVSALPKDKLGLLFVNPTDLVQSALSEADPAALTGFPQVATLKAIRGMGVSLSAEPDGFSFDSTVSYDTARLDPSVRAQLDVPVHENKLIGYVPTESFLVASQEGYDQALRQGLGFLSGSEGEGIRSLLHLDDAIESLTGDVVFESSPGSGGSAPGGAVLLGVKDPRPMQVTLDAIAGLIGGAWKTTTYHGETVRFFEDPDLGRYDVAPAYATFGDAAVLATSPAEIRKLIDVQEGSPSISSSSAYSSAMARVPSGDGTFYLDVSGLVAVVEGLLPSGERAGFDGEVRPNLDPIESVAASAANSSKRQTGRLFVAIKD